MIISRLHSHTAKTRSYHGHTADHTHSITNNSREQSDVFVPRWVGHVAWCLAFAIGKLGPGPRNQSDKGTHDDADVGVTG